MANTKQVIGVEKARQILGKDADLLSDEEINELISNLDLLAQAYIQAVQKDDKLIVNRADHRCK